jgi:hypothetical protein
MNLTEAQKKSIQVNIVAAVITAAMLARKISDPDEAAAALMGLAKEATESLERELTA